MIIFLYGPDDYRRVEKKRSIIAEFEKKRSSIGMDNFDFEDKNAIERFGQFARTQSIFEAAKLAVLENAFELEAPKLAKLLKPFVERRDITILIVEKDKPVKALAFLLDKPTISQKFEQLAGAELIAFIKAEAKEREVNLSETAVQFLATIYETNTWALVTEIQKLSGFKGGAKIERKDLAVFDMGIAPNYWGLLNGLKSYEIKNRLYSFEKMLAANDPAAKIFNILASQWQEKTPHMAEYDLAIKSGKVDYEEALVDLLIS
jgi:DNA polymerase III delta subunit